MASTTKKTTASAAQKPAEKPSVKAAAVKPATSRAAAPAKPAPEKAAAKPAAKPAAKAPAPKAEAKPAAKAPAFTPKPAAAAPKAAAPASTVKPAAAKAAPKVEAPPAPVKPAPAPAPRKHEFRAGDFVVYPTHGVGRIEKIDEQEVAGIKLELFVIQFEKDKMILRVPTTKAKAVGMRKLSTPDVVATALNTLKGRARIKRTMWSRRAQEYEAKINSGDLVSIAEVVRDLHRASGQPEQSYSERQLYEAALARMAREVAAIERIDEQAAVKRVEGALVRKAA
jgi:CarD family transcriptional regulator